jgi:hypothetical protein
LGKIPSGKDAVSTKRNNMILILEGVDGSGKSTLKEQIKAHYEFVEPIPKSLPTHKTTETMCGENASALNLAIYNNENVILDRGWMSEAIYSKVLRRAPSRFTPTHVAMFERMALTAGVTVVHCNPGAETIRQNLSARGDEHIRELSVLQELINEYKKFDSLTSLNVIDYNYKRHSLSWLLEHIWDAREGGHTGKTLFGNGYADTLIVTELDRSKPLGYIPMVSWNTGSAGYEFTERLLSSGLRESDLAWTTSQGSALRNLVVGNHFTRVAYVGAKLAISVEGALDGLPIDVRYIPYDGSHICTHLAGWRNED